MASDRRGVSTIQSFICQDVWVFLLAGKKMLCVNLS